MQGVTERAGCVTFRRAEASLWRRSNVNRSGAKCRRKWGWRIDDMKERKAPLAIRIGVGKERTAYSPIFVETTSYCVFQFFKNSSCISRTRQRDIARTDNGGWRLRALSLALTSRLSRSRSLVSDQIGKVLGLGQPRTRGSVDISRRCP